MEKKVKEKEEKTAEKKERIGRRWCFTLYPEKIWKEGNWTDKKTQKELLRYTENLICEGVPGVRGIRMSLEEGDSKEHIHIQGYMECENPKRFNALQKGIGHGIHLEVARGGREENFAYICHTGEHEKKGKLLAIHDFGIWPDQSGTERGAYDIAVGMILEGRTIISVARELKGAILPQLGNLQKLQKELEHYATVDLSYLRKQEIERDEWLRFQRDNNELPF